MRFKRVKLLNFIYIPLTVSPVCTMLKIINAIISAFTPMLYLLATAGLIDAVVSVVKNNASSDDVFKNTVVFVILIVYTNVNGVLMEFVNIKLNNNIAEKFEVRIVKKCASLEYSHMENAETRDKINRINSETHRISKGIDNLISFVRIIISIYMVLFILYLQVWWIAILIMLAYIPLFFISLKSGRANYSGLIEARKYDRYADYLSGMLVSRESVDERSLFGFIKKYNVKWIETYNAARSIENQVLIKNSIRENSAGLTTIIFSVICVGILVILLGNNELTIGIFVGLITQLFNMVRTVSKDFVNVTTSIASDIIYIKDLDAFFDLSEIEHAIDVCDLNVQKTKENTIKFENVSFKYPGTDRYILKNLSLILEPNLHYAFVGLNGAGKTTLIKLLCGLYDQYEGQILINGKERRSYTLSELKGIFYIVYQDYAKYCVSIKDSIMLGNFNEMENEKMLLEAIEEMEITPLIDKLTNKLETPIGKIMEDGVDLSGGEWQRIAIARSIVSRAPVKIFDEPTASLDPIAESKVYEFFQRINAGKSTIVITHRLGAAKGANQIIVIDDGCVLEQGTHDQLMKCDGMYKKLFIAQRSWYVS